MNIINPNLIKFGFKTIGLCSSLWVEEDSSFRGGIFLYHGRLHIVINLNKDRYFINEVQQNLVEICLRGELNLYNLATSNRAPFCWQRGETFKTNILDRIRLWYYLKRTKFHPLPNHYYLWNEYLFNATLKMENMIYQK